jgi:transposase
MNPPGVSGDSDLGKGWDGVMQGRRGGYPAELRERAVRLVAESRAHHDSEWAAITSVAAKLGVGCAETVRKWVRQAQIDAGCGPG